MPNMRWMRSAKLWISFCASRTESSGVFMIPLWMKRRRKSSSSALARGFHTLQHTFATCFTKGSRMMVFDTLKQVWNAAKAKVSWVPLGVSVAGLNPTRPQAKLTKYLKTHSTQMTPKTLKKRWPNAARRASVLAVSATRLAVSVVPMFSPMTSAIPR